MRENMEQYIDRDFLLRTTEEQDISLALNLDAFQNNNRIINVFKEAGFKITNDKSAPQIWVISDYNDPRLTLHNTVSMSTRQPWIPIRLAYKRLYLGPFFIPEKTACHDCLSHRVSRWQQYSTLLKEKRQGDNTLIKVKDNDDLGKIAESCLHILPRVMGFFLEHHLNGSIQSLENKILEVREFGEPKIHDVVKRPQCQTCGDISLINEPNTPPLFASREIQVNETGHRVQSSQSTYDRLEKHVSPVSGIIDCLQPMHTDFASTKDGTPMFYNFAGGYNMTFYNNKAYHIKGKLQSRSGGKGQSEIQALTSALCESIERYSGVYQGNEYYIRSSYNQLGEGLALDPEILNQYSAKQYKTRGELNPGTSAKQSVTRQFDKDKIQEWTPVWSLTEQKYKYVPSAHCYYGHPDIFAHKMMRADSNGSASGNTIEEAIIQGFLELIERDAVGIWWYNRIRRPRVNLDSFDSALINNMRELFDEKSRTLEVLDLTTDFGIPVYTAISADKSSNVEDILYGFGAHFSPEIALNRALLELGQSLPFVARKDKEGKTIYGKIDKEAIDWWQDVTLENSPYLVGDDSLKETDINTYERPTYTSILDELEYIKKLVADRGMEILFHNQTQPDIELSCVKVIVPGLRHFWRRLGEGRLYDVPVQMGWLDKANTEDELNPQSVHI